MARRGLACYAARRRQCCAPRPEPSSESAWAAAACGDSDSPSPADRGPGPGRARGIWLENSLAVCCAMDPTGPPCMIRWIRRASDKEPGRGRDRGAVGGRHWPLADSDIQGPRRSRSGAAGLQRSGGREGTVPVRLSRVAGACQCPALAGDEVLPKAHSCRLQ